MYTNVITLWISACRTLTINFIRTTKQQPLSLVPSRETSHTGPTGDMPSYQLIYCLVLALRYRMRMSQSHGLVSINSDCKRPTSQSTDVSISLPQHGKWHSTAKRRINQSRSARWFMFGIILLGGTRSRMHLKTECIAWSAGMDSTMCTQWSQRMALAFPVLSVELS